MNTKNNKRARDTDEKIVRALFRVMTLENKPLSRVTVREICEEAAGAASGNALRRFFTILGKTAASTAIILPKQTEPG